jgi:Flp pilus assembly protein protease CpaA
MAPFAVLIVATVCDLRTRRVPVWLTGGGIAAGVVGAALMGPEALRGSLAGAAAGGLVFFPFVLLGWLGGADALLLATVGAWHGWQVAIWAAWWTAVAGALLAVVVWAWRRRRGDVTHGARATPFPYVPAILAGTAAALFLGA